MCIARKWLLLAVLLTLVGSLLAACRPGAMQAQARRLFTRATPQAATTPPADSTNRIVVEGEDGDLYLISPDGKERFALTTDASTRRFYTQPTWSLDGTRLAWSQLDAAGSKLVVANFDGTQRGEFSVPYLPFYIAWSPNGSRLAYLSNWKAVDGPSMALRVVDPAGAQPASVAADPPVLSAAAAATATLALTDTVAVTATGTAADAASASGAGTMPDSKSISTLANGAPYYFAWAPGGDQLLAHLNGEQVEVQTVDGKKTSVVISGGAFPAPQWLPDGQRILYGAADDQTQRLLLSDPTGNDKRTLTTYDGSITFVPSPAGDSVAYVLTDRNAATSTLGPLYVVDINTLRTRELSDQPVLACYWSPDSKKLAYITLDTVDGHVGLRWNVWDGKSSAMYSSFFPTHTMISSYLPFFDQYAQSHRIWSPDSNAFVFAGTVESGESGIFVQTVGDNARLTNVGDGVIAFWSPK